MESSSPSNLSDGYNRKENCMTTSVRGAVREQAPEEQGGAEQDIYPLLFATLMGRRQEHREETTPLLLAPLTVRRQEREEHTVARHELRLAPVAMRVMMGRRQEGEKETG